MASDRELRKIFFEALSEVTFREAKSVSGY